MAPLHGKPLIQWQLANAKRVGVQDIVIVRGYRGERLQVPGARFVNNPDYATTNMVESLRRAIETESVLLSGGFVLSYGDIVCNSSVIESAFAFNRSMGIIVDLDWRDYWQKRFDDPLSDAETLCYDDSGRITDLGRRPNSIEEIMGQYIGMVAFSPAGVEALQTWFLREYHNHNMYMTDLIRSMVQADQEVFSIPVSGAWIEVDTLDDLHLAEKLASPNGDGLEIHR